MRYLFYFILTYFFLPLNSAVDFLTILVYFVILNEDKKFAILFAFFVGLLMDLYYPVSLGVNMLGFLVLTQGLIFIKKYFVREPITLIAVFISFYLIRILLVNVIPGRVVVWNTVILTVIFVLPVIFVLQKIFLKVWTKS